MLIIILASHKIIKRSTASTVLCVSFHWQQEEKPTNLWHFWIQLHCTTISWGRKNHIGLAQIFNTVNLKLILHNNILALLQTLVFTFSIQQICDLTVRGAWDTHLSGEHGLFQSTTQVNSLSPSITSHIKNHCCHAVYPEIACDCGSNSL